MRTECPPDHAALLSVDGLPMHLSILAGLISVFISPSQPTNLGAAVIGDFETPSIVGHRESAHALEVMS
jgi:hypothetical protein